ncbi:MAG: hypothetical protein GX633_10250, partial [Clostridiales bacterium]|nr:hypothetical protein [Clostridiales bacterium]
GTPWRNYLFRQNVRRYAISRLLDSVGDITNDSRARMSPACGLVCAVQVSHPGGRHASPKEVVSYSVKIRNKKNVDLPCEITFTPSEGVHIIDRGYVDTIVPAGASVCIPFRLIVPDTQEPYLDSPQVTVNSLQVFAPRVLTGSYGVDRFLSEEETISSLFFLHDSTQGYVLSRRTQSPCTDGALYSFFGGTGVITPSMAWESIGERSVSISIDDLRDGDRIVVSDDAVGKRSYSCVYSGGQLKGQFSFDGEEKSIKGSEAEEFIESLFGRFCFVVLRSS